VSPRVVGVEDLGVPTYDELVLVAEGDRIDKDPEPIRLFIEALQQGSRAAAADPAQATKTILAAGSGLDPKQTAAEMQATLPLLAQAPDPNSPQTYGYMDPAQWALLAQAPDPNSPQTYGYMDPAQWETFAGFLVASGALDSVPPVDEALTDDLLPPK
jgi:ABC-type nitrate/sulfonate/bicarbonate transport system substrate-binding protein